MSNTQRKNAIVRVDTSQGHAPPAPTTAVTQVQVIQDPNTGRQIQVVYDQNSGQYIPVLSMPAPLSTPQPQRPDPRENFLSGNAIGTHSRKRVRAIQQRDGTWAYEIDFDEAEVKARTVSDEEHYRRRGGINDIIGGTISKKRLVIGLLLTALLFMILADVVGVPHVRTNPGEYASLEGIKNIEVEDSPLVILRRLDRSVFLYTLDGIGWTFRQIGNLFDGG